MTMLQGRKILVGVGGGIAAYKVCTVVSALAQAGAEVRVMLTKSAEAFVTPLTFATLSRSAAYTDAQFWNPNQGRPLHIELGEWAELILLAPLTANTLGKLAQGQADNLLTNTLLASTCPVLLAPAMNTDMWEQQAVQRNWRQLLADRRYHGAQPGAGRLACDRVGTGRMAEPEALLLQLQSLLYARSKQDLAGKQILINAGGTREYLDPVRFMGNPSTGKMGLAIAQAALYRGAAVTLVHAPLATPGVALAGMRAVPVTTAQEMQREMEQAQPQADWIILCAAVADVKPASYSDHKLPKQDLPQQLALEPVPDIAAALVARKRPGQKLIGFAAQTGDFVTPALEKLQRKGLDAIAANPIDLPDSGFGSDLNQAVFLDRQGRQRHVPPCSKLELAHRLLDFILEIE
jgi:phosphopantothenoylcysteine decarboxylase / phosphopantothenate---cysteine ligase